MTEKAAAGEAATVDELADYFENPVELDVRGTMVTLKPLTIRQTGQIAGVLRSILKDAEKRGEPVDLDVASLVADYSEQMIAVVAIAAEQPKEWVAKLRADDFVTLATLAFRVNASFMLSRLAPRLAEIAPALEMAFGLASSRTSPAGGTPTPEA